MMVVVYKVDRLTRALSDFAKLVDVFDRRGVSFVSITQQFNTTTRMTAELFPAVQREQLCLFHVRIRPVLSVDYLEPFAAVLGTMLYPNERRGCGFLRLRTGIPIDCGQSFQSIADSIPMIADSSPIDGF
jgi:Resolvase, N terminal domain